jgi:hypothetical protein
MFFPSSSVSDIAKFENYRSTIVIVLANRPAAELLG